MPSPVGCYSTLASHQHSAPRMGGHDLPACFASPPTSPPMSARSHHPDEPMDTISLADPPIPPVEDSAAEDDLQPAGAELPADTGGGGAPAKPAGLPMAGLRDLFAPVGGLFKGAFTASSLPPPAAAASEEQQMQTDDSHRGAAGPAAASALATPAADKGESTPAAQASESRESPRQEASAVYEGVAEQSPDFRAAAQLPRPRGGGSLSGAISDPPAEVVEAAGKADLARAGAQPGPEAAHGEQPPQGLAPVLGDAAAAQHAAGLHSATGALQGESSMPEDSSGLEQSEEVASSSKLPSHSSNDLHREGLEHNAHPLNSADSAPSRGSIEAPGEADESPLSARADSHLNRSSNASLPDSVHDSSLDHGATKKPPFRGKHRR